MLVLAPAVAYAQNDATAEALFLEGRALMQEHRYAEACPRLKASYDADPAVGTLLNLALCHEATNKRASAWGEFRKVAELSAGKREDRVTLAREREAKLAPTLSWITITVPTKTRVEKLAITLDSAAVEEGAWGTRLPIDPGKHVVRVTAPGFIEHDEDVVVPDVEPVKREVTIAPLQPLVVQPAPALPPAAEPPPDATSPLRTVGFVLAGAGIASAATGGVFGVLAIGQKNDADRQCRDGPNVPCANSSKAQSANDAARRDALVADITIGAGVLLAAAGVYLVLTHPRTSRTGLRGLPFVTAHGAGLGGSF